MRSEPQVVHRALRYDGRRVASGPSNRSREVTRVEQPGSEWPAINRTTAWGASEWLPGEERSRSAAVVEHG